MFDFVGVGVLVLLTVLFAWLLTRAWRARNAALKWIGTILTGLLTLLFGLLTVVSLVGFYRLNRTYANPVPNVTVAGTPEQIARGEKLVQICAGCHSSAARPPLDGQDFTVGGPPFGTLYAPNLTPTHLADWSDGEIVRAIREGVGREGRSLIIMPSYLFHNMSDEDVQSVVAYLRSQPAVEPDTPPKNINLLGSLMVNLGPIFTRQEPITQPITAPPEGPTAEYGEYLVSFIGCRDCHGQDLTGGVVNPAGGPPPGPNLTQIVPNWTQEQFITFFRTGVTPDGRQIDPSMMPWAEYSAFAGESDDDLIAIYQYLHGLPPAEGPAQ
jgi:mono/diheme cytochrome c family protein